MVLDDTAVALFETVLGRSSFLDRLAAGPADKRTLVADLDCSRSTVDRGIRELESAGLVEYDDGANRMTTLGERVAEGFADLAEATELRLRLEPFLEWVPEEEFGFDVRLLADADVVGPEPGDPYRAINRHIERIGSMDEGYFLLPFTGLHAAETAHDRIVEHGAECELVVSSDVAETFRTDDRYAEPIGEMVATGRLAVLEVSSDLPMCVGVIDDRVQIIAAEGDEPRALVESDRREVYEWATKTIETYKQQAEPAITPRSLEEVP